jgi:aryl-phospho-beta-D-glucosidase BglC (GH1 family)
MSRVRSLAQPFGVGLITERVLVASRFGGSLVLALFLLLGPSSVQAGDCEQLCDREFWESATPAAVKTLLAAGADVQARVEGGWTPLHFAAGTSETPAVVKTLLDAGADPTAKDTAGQTPFDLMNKNVKLKDTDVYWRLNDLRFE